MTDVILDSSLPVVVDSITTAYGSVQLNAKIPKNVVFTPAQNLMRLPSYRGYMVLNDSVVVYIDNESEVRDIYTDTVIGSIQYPSEEYRYMKLSILRKLMCINKLKKYLSEHLTDRIWLLNDKDCTLTIPQLPGGFGAVASYLKLPVQSESKVVLTMLIDDMPVTLFLMDNTINCSKLLNEQQTVVDYVESCQMDEGKEMYSEI